MTHFGQWDDELERFVLAGELRDRENDTEQLSLDYEREHDAIEQIEQVKLSQTQLHAAATRTDGSYESQFMPLQRQMTVQEIAADANARASKVRAA